MDALREMFRYHVWATLTLIDTCMGLPSEALHEAVRGTYGSILNTFVHLVGADQRYLKRLSRETPQSLLSEGDVLLLADVRRRFEEQAPRWEALLDRVEKLEDLDVTVPAEADGSWPETRHAQNLILLQAIHHGNDHRTHICTALSVLGVEAPDIDGWAYWLATHQPNG